jgi:OOP family OmpA-OmpF porin
MTKLLPRIPRYSALALAGALAAISGVAASQTTRSSAGPSSAPPPQSAASGATAATEGLAPIKTPGYVVASDGRPVLSGFGSCVRSTYWTLANSVDPCDQIARVSVPVPVVAYEQRAAPPPPPPPVVLAQPEPPRTVIQKLTLSADVLFDFNKAQLRDAGKGKLDELAAQVKDAKVDEIVVVGHADRIASEQYNRKLSEDRALAVKSYLAERGATTNVINAQGKGESEPVTGDQCRKMGPERASNKKLIECLQPDRRVEIEVLGSREVAGTGAPAAGATR